MSLTLHIFDTKSGFGLVAFSQLLIKQWNFRIASCVERIVVLFF